MYIPYMYMVSILIEAAAKTTLDKLFAGISFYMLNVFMLV